MPRPRSCPLCNKRLFLAHSGVYHCPKGHQTVMAGYKPVLRVALGKLPWYRRLYRKVF